MSLKPQDLRIRQHGMLKTMLFHLKKKLSGTQTSSHSFKLETGSILVHRMFPVCLLQPSLLGFQKPTRGARSEPCTSFGSRNTKGWVGRVGELHGFWVSFLSWRCFIKRAWKCHIHPDFWMSYEFFCSIKNHTPKNQAVCRRLPVNPQWGKGNFGKIPRLQPPKLPSSKLT